LYNHLLKYGSFWLSISFFMKTHSIKLGDVVRDWYVVDAADRTLGRLATEIAHRLRGKHKPEYTPHVDVGDYIIVVNAERIRVTGDKMTDKLYWRHSGYPGGIKSVSLGRLLGTHPTRVLQKAVTGMMPRNRLGRSMLKKLKIYAGPEHPHAAQQPENLVL